MTEKSSTDANTESIAEFIARVDELSAPSGHRLDPITDDDIAAALEAQIGSAAHENWAQTWARIRAGRRGISTIETAVVAGLLRTSAHYLITGEPDPHRMRTR